MSKFLVTSARCSNPKRNGTSEYRDRKFSPQPPSSSEDDVRRRARSSNVGNGNATRMDELATITRKPIRKRVRNGNKCNALAVNPTSFPTAEIASLPVEIIFEILSYLDYKDLCAVRRVSVFFERLARDPFLWRAYEVTESQRAPWAVIRMYAQRETTDPETAFTGQVFLESILRSTRLPDPVVFFQRSVSLRGTVSSCISSLKPSTVSRVQFAITPNGSLDGYRIYGKSIGINVSPTCLRHVSDVSPTCLLDAAASCPERFLMIGVTEIDFSIDRSNVSKYRNPKKNKRTTNKPTN